MARFKIKRGKMLIIPPGEKAKWEEAELVYDSVNNSFGIKLIADNRLQGYVIFVGQTMLRDVRDKGKPMDKLTI